MKSKAKRRTLMAVVALITIAAPAMTYAAYSSRWPASGDAAAQIAAVATRGQSEYPLRVPEEAAMLMAGMALIGAAAVVRRAA